MAEMAGVGGYNNSWKCLFSLTIWGANYTFSRDFDFSATVVVGTESTSMDFNVGSMG